MTTINSKNQSNTNFWQPEFNYEKRNDGSILMSQVEPLPPYFETIAEYLEYWAEKSADTTWLARRSHQGSWITISYAEALAFARSLGGALIDLGLNENKPLLILSENSIEHGLLSIACSYVGIPYAPVSPAYSLVSQDHGKLKSIAQLLNPGALYADDGHAFAKAIEAISNDQVVIINHHNPVSDSLDLYKLVEKKSNSYLNARKSVTKESVVKYLFTSGSTGTPKAVINTNDMICAMQAMVRDCYRFVEVEPPIVVDWAPWNHTAAGNKVFYMVLTNGGTYYIDDGNPSPVGMQETVRNLKEVACTWYFNVPAGYDLLADALEVDAKLAENFFSKLRMLFYAGAAMAQHTWDRLTAVGQKTTGTSVLIASGLGATETAPFALAWTEHETKAGNIGVPSRGLTMKLVENGGKLEIRLKGPSITPGYYGDDDKTADAFDEEGFYKLGDALQPVDSSDLSRGFFFGGRIAENFKLATGTWVAVGAMRLALVNAMDGLIKDAVIVGENCSSLGALVWLSEAAQSMQRSELRQSIAEKLLVHVKASTGSASRVVRIAPLPCPPSFDKGEITEKSTLNQRLLRTNNASAIDSLYSIEADNEANNCVVVEI